VSVSNDLKWDAERDLADMNLAPAIPVYPKDTGTLPKGPLAPRYTEVGRCTLNQVDP
jgi:hypothetical protein